MEKQQLIHHNILTRNNEKACFGMSYSNNSMDIFLARSQTYENNHQCFLPKEILISNNQIPSQFESSISENKVPLIIDRVFDTDGHALTEFNSNKIIKKTISLSNPLPLIVESINPTLENFRNLSQNSGSLIRPILLKEPDISELMPFQHIGLEWLQKMDKGILADDMGLGKTVQVIAALRKYFYQGVINNALIICPKSLIANWEQELTKWAPELSRLRIVPNSKIRKDVWSIMINRVHILLSNYEHFRETPSELIQNGVDIIIADEAHRIRNVGSRTASGIRKIKHKRFWALTGTPIERHPEDLASLLSTIEPTRFSKDDGNSDQSYLREQSRKYMLRRLKIDVLPELPNVIENTEILDLMPKQRSSYTKILKKLKENKDVEMIAIVNELRTICDYDINTKESIKAIRINEILNDIQSVNEKAVVFSYLLEPLNILQEFFDRKGNNNSYTLLRGDMNSSEREKSIYDFKNDKNITTLLCSSRVGGEGLTLTEANHVIFFNEWWNPSSNAQARDRVVRIGQNKGVQVYKFICKDTIEENLEMILKNKSTTFTNLIDKLADKQIHSSALKPVLDELNNSLL